MSAVFVLLLALRSEAPGKLVSMPFSRGDKIFTSREQPDGWVEFCVQKGLSGTPRAILNSRQVPEIKVKAFALDNFMVSDDGRLCAYFVTQASRQYEEIRVIDIDSARKLDDEIFWTHRGDFGWRSDGFYYGGYRKPEPATTQYSDERVMFHRLGTSQDEDQVVYADPQHPKQKYQFLTTFDHRFLMLHIMQRLASGVVTSEWFRSEGSADRKFIAILPDPIPGRTYLCDNVGDELILDTPYRAPDRRIVAVDTRHPDESQWKTLLPGPVEESDMVLGQLVVLTKEPGGGMTAKVYSPDAKSVHTIPTDTGATIDVQACPKTERYAFFSIESKGTTRYFSTDRKMQKLTLFQ